MLILLHTYSFSESMYVFYMCEKVTQQILFKWLTFFLYSLSENTVREWNPGYSKSWKNKWDIIYMLNYNKILWGVNCLTENRKSPGFSCFGKKILTIYLHVLLGRNTFHFFIGWEWFWNTEKYVIMHFKSFTKSRISQICRSHIIRKDLLWIKCRKTIKYLRKIWLNKLLFTAHCCDHFTINTLGQYKK
jgi:hypothetical protein